MHHLSRTPPAWGIHHLTRAMHHLSRTPSTWVYTKDRTSAHLFGKSIVTRTSIRGIHTISQSARSKHSYNIETNLRNLRDCYWLGECWAARVSTWQLWFPPLLCCALLSFQIVIPSGFALTLTHAPRFHCNVFASSNSGLGSTSAYGSSRGRYG